MCNVGCITSTLHPNQNTPHPIDLWHYFYWFPWKLKIRSFLTCSHVDTQKFYCKSNNSNGTWLKWADDPTLFIAISKSLPEATPKCKMPFQICTPKSVIKHDCHSIMMSKQTKPCIKDKAMTIRPFRSVHTCEATMIKIALFAAVVAVALADGYQPGFRVT